MKLCFSSSSPAPSPRLQTETQVQRIPFVSFISESKNGRRVLVPHHPFDANATRKIEEKSGEKIMHNLCKCPSVFIPFRFLSLCVFFYSFIRLRLSISCALVTLRDSQLQCAICFRKTFVLLLMLSACHIIIIIIFFRFQKNLTRVMICMWNTRMLWMCVCCVHRAQCVALFDSKNRQKNEHVKINCRPFPNTAVLSVPLNYDFRLNNAKDAPHRTSIVLQNDSAVKCVFALYACAFVHH